MRQLRSAGLGDSNLRQMCLMRIKNRFGFLYVVVLVVVVCLIPLLHEAKRAPRDHVWNAHASEYGTVLAA